MAHINIKNPFEGITDRSKIWTKYVQEKGKAQGIVNVKYRNKKIKWLYDKALEQSKSLETE